MVPLSRNTALAGVPKGEQGTAVLNQRYARMAILRHSPSVPRPDPAPAERAALARLCEREGLDASETAGVLAVALTWAPGRRVLVNQIRSRRGP